MASYNTALIQIETDYEFVKNKIEDNTARFIMDFNNVEGPLKAEIHNLARFMEQTAKNFVKEQTERHTGNLIEGVIATVNNNVIELKSSAYKLPSTVKKDKEGKSIFGGQDIKYNQKWRQTRYKAKRDEKGRYIRNEDKEIQYETESVEKGTQRVIHYRHIKKSNFRDDVLSRSKSQFSFGQIIPQNIYVSGAYRGATGLNALGSHHINRFLRTQTIQYYGGHIEFGHRAPDGSFVMARPHLRPALRIASAASIGQFQGILKQMLEGVGNTFDGYRTPSLTFGLQNVSGLNTSTLAHEFALQRGGHQYGVRHGGGMWNNIMKNDMGWGRIKRPVDYAKYGYNRNIPTSMLKSKPSGKGKLTYSKFKLTEHDAIYGTKARPWGTGKRTAPAGKKWYIKEVNGKPKWVLGKDNTQKTSYVHPLKMGTYNTQQHRASHNARRRQSSYRQHHQSNLKRVNKKTQAKKSKKQRRTSRKRANKPSSYDFSSMTKEELEAYRANQIGAGGKNILKKIRGK